MSETAMYTAGILVEDKNYAKKSDIKLKALKILVFIFAIILVVEVVVYLIFMPLYSSVDIFFTGQTNFTETQLRSMCGTEIEQPWINFNTENVVMNLSQNYSIESVIVEKRFPDKVFVQIYERIPVAATLVSIDDKTVSVQIDKNGVLFSMDERIPNENIPLITGLAFDGKIEGTRLHRKLRPIAEQIATIQKSNPSYFSVISEIRVIPKEYDNYDLMVYPVQYHTRVLTDRNLSLESLQYMMIVLDVIDKLEENVKEVDLRYGSVSYKTVL
ncbi:MAG: FtsQ-type POTRA domain-containing protein [Treponema sp.]|nr:FtsQ-type POTRA domain-containing protein [Treponema sp.]